MESDKRLIAIIMALTILSSGLVCQYSTNPLVDSDITIPFVPEKYQVLQDRMIWSCVSNMSNYSCISSIHDGNTSINSILQTNPDGQIVEGIGYIDKFMSDGRTVNVYFKAESNVIRSGQPYLFDVHCSNGTTSEVQGAIVTPQYRQADAPITYFATFMSKSFIGELLIFGAVLALIAVLSIWAYQQIKAFKK